MVNVADESRYASRIAAIDGVDCWLSTGRVELKRRDFCPLRRVRLANRLTVDVQGRRIVHTNVELTIAIVGQAVIWVTLRAAAEGFVRILKVRCPNPPSTANEQTTKIAMLIHRISVAARAPRDIFDSWVRWERGHFGI